MLVQDNAYFFFAIYLIFAVPVTVVLSVIMTILMNIIGKKKWQKGALRNVLVGMAVSVVCWCFIVLSSGKLVWRNGEPVDLYTRVWQNAGAISLLVSLMIVAVIHIKLSYSQTKELQ